jgi:pimeloyl-ACP methyl ester carboxylesterase
MTAQQTRRDVAVNGITLHITEQGEGPLLLLCHGWPELGYSWRHQMPALAAAGYRAVALDMRGYGGSSVPHDVAAYAMSQLVGDLVALTAALGETRAGLIGHDWGASVVWNAALMRPDLFAAVAALSVPYRPRNPAGPPLALLRAAGLNDFYWFYFGRDGVPEAEFERDPDAMVRRVLYSLSGDSARDHPMMVPPGAGFLDATTDPEQLPAWLSAADVKVFADSFRNNGMRGPFNYYRTFDRNWTDTAPFQGAVIQPPAVFIAGTRDVVITSQLGRRALEAMPASVPLLRDIVLLDGAGHWIQQERPTEVNAALLKFLKADYPA